MGIQRSYFSALLLVIAVAASLALSCLSIASDNDVSSLDPQIVNNDFHELLRKAQDFGKVRVVVRLNATFTPEGKHVHSAELYEQRANISNLQETLLESLSISDETHIRKFKYIPFIAMEADEAMLTSLAVNPVVAGISEDELRNPMLWDTVPLIGANTGVAALYSGAGQTVAILDTGIDKTHPFLEGKVVEEACYSSHSPSIGRFSFCPNGLPSQVGNGSGIYCSPTFFGCTHGTHVAGIAAGKRISGTGGNILRGVAPDANIIAIQVFHRKEYGCPSSSPCILTLESDYTAALEHIYELRDSYKIAAVNMSLGGGWYPSNCDNVNVSIAMVKAAIDNLRSVGIPTIVASGNDSYLNGISAPGCISSAVSVGATQYLGSFEQVASYSNSASFLSLLAPGGSNGSGFWDIFVETGIYSSVLPERGYWGKMPGTSMAAPHVAGAWALLKQVNPPASVDAILTALQSTGKPFTDTRIGSNGLATNIIKPRIQVDAALNVVGHQPNLTPHKPSGWSDKIVVSKTMGTNTDSSPLYTTDTLYVDWAVINDGSVATSTTFYTQLYVDGVLKQTWQTNPPLNPNRWCYILDYPMGSLSAGTHTIKIVADSTNAVDESNESDNEYTKTITVQASAISYTVTTNPSGLQVAVDGTTYTSPKPFSWIPGSSHTLSVSSPQSGTSGTRYVYSSWSDGGAQSHTITVPSSSTTFTANFTTQFSLTTSVNPSAGGVVTPSGTNWYNSGQTVSVSASANAGYSFSNWSGDLSGSTNPASLVMTRPKNVTANFSLVNVFLDVPSGYWAYDYIIAIYNNGITTGCVQDDPSTPQNERRYCPEDSVTRGQMAAFIIRAKYGENFTYTQTPYFSDVPSNHIFFKYVQKMKDEGLTAVSGIYMVDEPVTRGQMAAFIIRAKFGENFTYTQTPYFSDVPATHNFFKYVQKLKDEGITAVSGTYGVDDIVTRAQMAAFLARAFLGME